jgi:carbamoyltransferase
LQFQELAANAKNDELCGGTSRENTAGSIQKLVEDILRRAIDPWLKRTNTRRLALAGGLFANVRLNRLLAQSLRSMRCSCLLPWAMMD